MLPGLLTLDGEAGSPAPECLAHPLSALPLLPEASLQKEVSPRAPEHHMYVPCMCRGQSGVQASGGQPYEAGGPAPEKGTFLKFYV